MMSYRITLLFKKLKFSLFGVVSLLILGVGTHSHPVPLLFCHRFANQVVTGAEEIFKTLSNIRGMLAGERTEERLVHVVENLQCCAFAKRGVMIRVSGVFVIGTQFVPTGEILFPCAGILFGVGLVRILVGQEPEFQTFLMYKILHRVLVESIWYCNLACAKEQIKYVQKLNGILFRNPHSPPFATYCVKVCVCPHEFSWLVQVMVSKWRGCQAVHAWTSRNGAWVHSTNSFAWS